MKRFAIALACVLSLPVASLAAESDSTVAAAGRPNSLHAGAWAVQLSLDGGLNSGGVFFKKHRKPNHAVRFGAEFSLSTRDADVSADTSSVAFEKGTREIDQFSAQVELISQRYANVTGSAHVFYGIGPFFSYQKFSDEESRSNADESFGRLIEHEDYRVGGVFLVGGEWFASRALSLGIEYRVTFGYLSETHDSTYDDPGAFYPVVHSSEEFTGWFFDAGNSVRFTFGIYF